MADSRATQPRAAAAAPVARARWKTITALVLGTAGALYAGVFAFSVTFSARNPAAATAVRPMVTEATETVADLALFSAGQSALESKGQVASGAIPPSLISGIGLEIDAATQARVRGLALAALRSSPLVSSSLRQLAFFEPVSPRKWTLLELSERVSKRDVLATLQLAELRLRRNDVDAGLAGLDRALTVSQDVDTAVFPMLMGAVAAQPDARARVGGLIAGEKLWTERLVRWSIANPAALPALSAIVARIPAKSPARAPGYGQQMVDQLAGQGQWGPAFAVYRTYSPKAQDVGDMQRSTFAPLDWRLIDDYDTGSRTVGGAVELFANPGRGGQVAQIITRLAPGAHRLALTVRDSQPGDLTLAVDCLQGTAALPGSRSTLPLTDGAMNYAFSIPGAGCQFQRLSLALTARNDSAGALITSVRLDGAPAARQP